MIRVVALLPITLLATVIAVLAAGESPGSKSQEPDSFDIEPPILKQNLSNEPRDIYEYFKTNPTFPHETTADQFFSESQFESYRMLGAYTMEKLWQRFPSFHSRHSGAPPRGKSTRLAGGNARLHLIGECPVRSVAVWYAKAA